MAEKEETKEEEEGVEAGVEKLEDEKEGWMRGRIELKNTK